MTTTTARAAVERVMHPLRPRRLSVIRTETLSPALRRLVLAGPDLEDFVALGPADHVKLFLPAGPGADVVLPAFADGRWTNRDDERLTYRDMTVRTFHPEDGELVIEMVAGDHGPASRWAAQAAPGDVVGVLGPRGSLLPPLDRDHYVLAADETGVPALANWLDRLPPSARVHALVEVADADAHVDLPAAADVTVTWLHRDRAAPGTVPLLSEAAADVLRGLDPAAAQWWWAAGETSQVRAIRTMLGEAGVGRDSFAMTGYWRRGEANFDHHSPDA